MTARALTAACAVLAGAVLIVAVRAMGQWVQGLDCSGGYGDIGAYEELPTTSLQTERSGRQ
ncbi:hypothetical protein ACQP2U_42750 (plasmid) [Nocardia sp. CA-084685]|uniref:hypothetical protein n=1 Tax=Nocardia sp. CA-084685 TaxID=3239970 RepID=UPI003D99EF70